MSGTTRLARQLLKRAGLHVQRYPGADNLRGATLRVMKTHNVDLVIDVGANVGQYATRLRDLGWTGPIVSVEPVPEAFEQLDEACNEDGGWTAHRLALGASDDILVMNVTASSSVSSFLEPTDEYVASYEGGRTVREERVRVARLDSVMDDLAGSAGRVLLKCDTQGYDLEVIAGAAGVLHRVVAIQSELSIQPIYAGMPSWIEAVQAIAKIGFAPVGFWPVTSDRALRAIELDGLFVRADL